jgi:hypothetical protein
MEKKKKETSKNLDSCSTRLSWARIRCLPLVSGPSAATEETASSSTDDAVSDAITVKVKIQKNSSKDDAHPKTEPLIFYLSNLSFTPHLHI